MPKVKNQHFVTMYTPESFVEKREKGERLEFAKIPIASTDIGTITNKQKDLGELQEEEQNDNPLSFNYDESSNVFDYESTYAYLRLNEFWSWIGDWHQASQNTVELI